MTHGIQRGRGVRLRAPIHPGRRRRRAARRLRRAPLIFGAWAHARSTGCRCRLHGTAARIDSRSAAPHRAATRRRNEAHELASVTVRSASPTDTDRRAGRDGGAVGAARCRRGRGVVGARWPVSSSALRSASRSPATTPTTSERSRSRCRSWGSTAGGSPARGTSAGTRARARCAPTSGSSVRRPRRVGDRRGHRRAASCRFPLIAAAAALLPDTARSSSRSSTTWNTPTAPSSRSWSVAAGLLAPVFEELLFRGLLLRALRRRLDVGARPIARVGARRSRWSTRCSTPRSATFTVVPALFLLGAVSRRPRGPQRRALRSRSCCTSASTWSPP